MDDVSRRFDLFCRIAIAVKFFIPNRCRGKLAISPSASRAVSSFATTARNPCGKPAYRWHSTTGDRTA